MEEEIENVVRQPANENIWYKLATIAGKPKDESDENIISANRNYWNGLMSELMTEKQKTECAESKTSLVKLSVEEKAAVEKVLGQTIVDFKNQQSSDGIIDFRLLNFEHVYVDFSGYVFCWWTMFNQSIFRLEVSFNNAFFLSNFICKNAEFKGDVTFENAEFKGDVTFENAEFKGDVTFENAEFKGIVSNDGATFYKQVKFRKVKFHSDAKFIDAKFKHLLSFSFAIFYTSPPYFFNTEITGAISWRKVKLPQTTVESEYADLHIAAYERLAHLMDKMGKHHDKLLFFSKEMKIRQEIENNFFSKSVYKIYDTFSGYGINFIRALIWWLSHIILGSIFLIPYQNVETTRYTITKFKNYNSDQVMNYSFYEIGSFFELWIKSLTISFSNAHSFLKLNRGSLKDLYAEYGSQWLIIPFNTIWTIQALIGGFLFFFLLLTIRNRFKMG